MNSRISPAKKAAGCLARLPARRFAASGTPAFTLVELLAVMAIILVLSGLAVSAGRGAMESAHATQCLSNLRQIGVAMQLYVGDNDGTTPPAWQSSSSRWMDSIKPYIPKSCSVFRCPSDPKQIPCNWDPQIILSFGVNSYRFGDQAHCFWYGVKLQNVPRPAGTILIADCTPGKYYCGGGGTFAEPVVDVDYRHQGKSFCAIYCDGHAAQLTKTTQQDWDASQ